MSLMKNISFLLLFSCFFGFYSHAQKLNYNKDYLRAEELFGKGKYLEVLPILEELDSTVDDPNVDYLIGMTLKSMKSKESEAIPYLEKYVASSDSLDQAYFFLAELYHWNYRFDDAINMYERFEEIALPKIKDEVLQEFLLSTVSKRIAECNYGKISISDPRKVIIENCGPQINSEFPEYAPVISNDENRLIYTARNSNSTGGKKDRTGAFFEDIYYTELLSGGLFDPIRLDTLTSGGGYITLVTDFKYEAPKKMWGGVNKKGHDGAIQLTLNEDSLYFYRNSDIWISSMSDTLSEGKPVKFDFVNSSAYEPSVYLSSNGQTIYVSSEREGGFGGLDLYESHKLPDGSWTPLENLGPKINTPYDEDAPYIDPDGITVYFSSKGHSSMGGYDVFKTIKDPVSGWQDIENMGYPVNTPGDDIYYVMTPKYNRAYYSSDNLKGYGDMDIYRLTFADERHPMAELKGLVLEGENYVPAKSKITMLHSDSSILSTFVSDSSSGQYLVLLGHGKQYDMLVQTDGFMPYKKKFTIPEQKEYYQLYQEIHHIHLFDNFGNIIGQQVVIYNSFEDGKGSDTTSIFYDQRTKEQLNRIINLREGDRVDVYSDILFYLGKDSIAKILAEDTTLSFNFPSNTSCLLYTSPSPRDA